MMIVLLIAGIGSVLAGLLAIAFGIPIKEFGFGNTLILVGVVAVCTGMILLGIGAVVRELKTIAQRLRPVEQRARAALPSILSGAAGEEEFAFDRDGAATENTGNAELGATSSPPWHEQTASRDRSRADAPHVPAVAHAPGASRSARHGLLRSRCLSEERRAAQGDRGADKSRRF